MDGDDNNTGSLPSAPPPPPEVKVRTMRSDLESMAKSGGGLPRFQNVQVAGLTLDKAQNEASAQKKSGLLKAILITAGLLVVAGGIYFAYRIFFSGMPQAQPQAPASSAPSSTSQQPSVTSPSASPATSTAPAFIHSSFFAKAPDQVLSMSLAAPGGVQNSADLQSYNQKILGTLLGAAKPTSTIIEIDVKAADGHDLSIGELLSQAGATVLNSQFLAANFNPDATFFVYHDKNGFWPGYIIGLTTPGAPSSLVATTVKQLEASPNISSFFLTDEKTASPSGFADSTANGVPVRTLSFSGNSAASFTYGWVSPKGNTYLILSASLAGFAQATSRL